MANLASTAVTITQSREIGDRVGRYVGVALIVNATLSGQGTVTNTIPVSAMGLSFAYDVSNFVMCDDTLMYIATLNDTGTLIYLKHASTNAFADYSGKVKFTLAGYK